MNKLNGGLGEIHLSNMKLVDVIERQNTENDLMDDSDNVF